MFISITKQMQVFNTIISFIIIDMMYYFRRFKISANLLFHNKAMFKDIIIMRKRMIMNFNINISTTYGFTASPTWITFVHTLRPWAPRPRTPIRVGFLVNIKTFPRTIFARLGHYGRIIKYFFTDCAYYFYRCFFVMGWSTLFRNIITFYRAKDVFMNKRFYNGIFCGAYWTNFFNSPFRIKAFARAIFSIPMRIIEYFATCFTYMFHVVPQLKRPLSACLIETVKFLRLLRAKILNIKIPLPPDNYSIPQVS